MPAEGADEPGRALDERRLPRAVGAQQADELGLADRQIDAAQRGGGAVALGQALDLERGRHERRRTIPCAAVPTVRIRRGSAADAALVLALFDEAVAWLVARGQTGQWGTEPWSERPRAVAMRARLGAGPEGLRIAHEDDATPLGALVLGAHPPHVEPIDEPERYVEALVTSRRHAGRGIGSLLVAAAAEEARAGGRRGAARRLLGGRPAAGGLVRAPGLPAPGTLRRRRLDRAGLRDAPVT